MLPQLKRPIFLALVFLFLVPVPYSEAVSPMWSYISLVAGEGDAGFKDGDFPSALFNQPVALACDPSGRRLFVADKDNHRIRMIDLENHNQVTTLAGSGKSGQADGDLKTATFNLPIRLVFIPENKLVVYDAGSNRLRLIDLQSGKVTTLLALSGKRKPNLTERVESLAYASADQSLYFSQPDLEKLTSLQLNTMESKEFHHIPQLLHPGALTARGGKIIAADVYLPAVYQVDSITKDSNGVGSPQLTEVGKGENILFLAASGDKLYALQGTPDPWVQIAPHPGPVKIMTQAGNFLEAGQTELSHLFYLNKGAGFLAEPNQLGNFYLALPQINCVISFKDYDFDAQKGAETENENGLMDFTYPDAKPPGVFRLLELGDSRLFFEVESERGKAWPWGYNRMVTSPKRLELFLNTWATLNNEDTHYQVLHSGARRAFPIHLRAYFAAPKLAQKFDVDQVLILLPLDFSIRSYQEFRYGPEGLPNLIVDPEFLQSAVPKRLQLDKDPLLSDIYQRCLDRHLMKPGEVVDMDLPGLVSDEKTRQDLLALAAKPLKMLAAKMKDARTKAGRPVGLGVVFFPIGNTGGEGILPTEPYRSFWKEACVQAGIPFYDLTDAVVSTRLSFYPTTEFIGYRHFNDNGHDFFATLIAQMLMKEKLIPLGTAEKK